MRCDTNEIRIQTNESQTYVARFYKYRDALNVCERERKGL